MFKYTTIYINIISFFISLIIFFILNFFYSNFNNITQNTSFKVGFSVNNIEETQEIDNIQINSIDTENENSDWYLEIPNINLKANIAEGTTKEIMDKYIGHFEETQKITGNIALAAHNRGYENNYFHNLKELKEGDDILYTYKGETKEYIVEKHYIIDETDVSCLEDTEENIITLITCVENEPKYRRCIQGIEKLGKEE